MTGGNREKNDWNVKSDQRQNQGADPWSTG